MRKEQPPGTQQPRPRAGRRGVLSREDIEEIRFLRAADPAHWSYARLARAFGVSRTAIGLVCRAVGC